MIVIVSRELCIYKLQDSKHTNRRVLENLCVWTEGASARENLFLK